MPSPLQYERTAAFEDSPTGGVTSIAFSPTGVHLASAGLDCRVCIWRVADSSLAHNFAASSPILLLAWVPSHTDGMLVCGCQDGSIIALTTPTPQVLRGSNLPRTHSFPVEHLAVMGKRLVSGAHTELAIWQLSSADRWFHVIDLGIPPKNSYNEDLEVLATSVHWTTSKRRRSLLLATYMHHGYVVYDASNWSRVLAIPMNSLIANASITPDGRKLAVSNMVSGFDIYDTDTGSSLGTLSHVIDRIYAVPILFAHGGNAVIGGSTVGEIDIWDVANLRKHQTLGLGGKLVRLPYPWRGS
ncbi:WD40-repeat-containing domain protein [Ganoderma leucocontextum]|nr:WD40-repeat-containing domain protein [Ganoderma leucocontextum]